MKLEIATPLSLYKIRAILEESPEFTKSFNIGNLQNFCEKLYLDESPGNHQIYLIKEENLEIGFIKLAEAFPLPGFIFIDLLVFKQEQQNKGHGKNLILNLLKGKTLWINDPSEHHNEQFWKKLGFKEEAGRWLLQASRI